MLCKYNSENQRGLLSEGLHVHPNRLGSRIRLLNQALTVHLAFNPVWIVWLWWQCRRINVDVIIVRNLRLAPPALVAGRLLSVPVVADLSENYPALASIESRTKPHHYLTRVPFIERFFEDLTVRKADHVWVVVSENKRRLVDSIGVEPSKISVISNVPTDDVVSVLSAADTSKRASSSEPLTLVFLGIVDPLRGLDVVIEAVALANKACGQQRVRLVIIGDGISRPDLETQVRRLGIGDDVHFTGWIGSDKKYEYLAQGDLGLIPHVDCELCQTTVPNKLFDYMGAAIPVLSTDLQPIRRVLETYECGVVMPWDAHGMADEMVRLAGLPAQEIEAMGRNGRVAVEEDHNWGREEPEITQTLNRVATAHESGTQRHVA